MKNNILDKEILTHDELIDQIFSQYELANKNRVTSLFLASLSNKNLELRSGLSVFAIMQTFPRHNFELRANQQQSKFSPCAICSNWLQKKNNTDFIQEAYENIGGLIGFGLLDYYYFLYKTNKINNASPNKEDFRIFSTIIRIILNAQENDTVKKKVQVGIGKINGFESNIEQRKALLETLGYCSILEANEHKGSLKRYTNLATAPKKTHSSDWNYPVDWWLGKDGINREAFKFWFGNYHELKEFW